MQIVNLLSQINSNIEMNPRSNNSNQKKHSRKHSGGVIAPSPLIKLKHIRTQSIIESSFTPATPMEFHPSISKGNYNINNANNGLIDSINGSDGNTINGRRSLQFKNKFDSSIHGIDGGSGPRIIRTASEATSDRSLSYKIPTMVSQIWNNYTIIR